MNHRPTSRLLIAFVVLCLIPDASFAQTTRRSRTPREDPLAFRDNPKMLAAFRGIVRKPNQSVVRVQCAEKEVALGTIVGQDGWILTKNSELTPGTLTVILRDERKLTAKVVGVDEKMDLAMLKVDAKDLVPIEWGSSKSAAVGNLLATPGMGTDPVSVGVLSVAARNVKPRDLPSSTPPADAGFLGVGLDEGEGGAKVMSVIPNSPAAKAGLAVNDIVFSIADTPVIDSESMINIIQHHKPGEAVVIKYRRGARELETRATLEKRPADPGGARRDFQNRMGSELSNRRGGFPAILQHDMVIKPSDCGGPLIDLDGKAIGLNIARAGRTETYALPSDLVQSAIADLKSGKSTTKPAPQTKPTTAPAK